MNFQNTVEFAQQLDAEDPLRMYRDQFIFPEYNGKEVIYFAGNSLGLQPKNVRAYVNEVMDSWAERAVEGHFHGQRPWWDYHERFSEKLAPVVGALPEEVSVMNTLTVNLHLLLVSFYRPTSTRFKIICEEKAFPSDQYMLASQVCYHGYNPEDAIVEIQKRDGEHTFRTEDILDKITMYKDDAALVFIGGVNYYSGQVFDMKRITDHAKQYGISVGWDLAHAVGNVELQLHDWGVDFASWCSYKYMNSGPGSVSGYFVHERHLNKNDIPRFEGWWGHSKDRRFLMEPDFVPEPDANAWQISNAPILSLAPYLASLEYFDQVGMESIINKRNQIVSYLEFILYECARDVDTTFEIITPKFPHRGTQLSVFLHGQGKSLFDYLMKNGVVLDWREPNVIRLAPAPLYCSYSDMFHFGQILKAGVQAVR